jgi:hypothetical protein
MINMLHEALIANLPPKTKLVRSGWRHFNAPCCHHRGHSPDTRGRGNLKIDGDGSVVYNCFNCAFKFVFDGSSVSVGFEQFLNWIGVDRSTIQKIKMEVFAKNISGGNEKAKNYSSIETGSLHFDWPTLDLPLGSCNIVDVLRDMEEGKKSIDEDFLNALEYLRRRGKEIFSATDYYWSSNTRNQMNQRIIIPFINSRNNEKKIVGYTARFTGSPVPRGVARYYNSEIPSGFLFNNGVAEIESRKFLVLVEGPFDALAIQGVGALGATLNERQIQWLLAQNKQIIVLPDRQEKNQTLIDTALTFGWSVSFPEWDREIKDAADACNKYGQVYTITSVLKSFTADPVEIGVRRQLLGK